MNPVLGFSPDAPRTTPGIITDCTAFIPYEAGMEAAPTPVSIGAAALAGAAIGGISWTAIDGTQRIFSATNQTKIFELTGGTTWTDRSAGGGTYAATNFVTFAPFGNAIVAALGTSTALNASTTGAFSAISGAPQARICFAVVTSGGGFVIAANTNVNADAWHCSGLNDHTTWTPSIATQANSGRLVGNDSGAITAGIEFGDRPIIFKLRSIILGNYVGGDTTFTWSEVPTSAGCVGPFALANIDTGVFFVGPDNIWIFDGSRPYTVADNQIRQWFYNDLNRGFRDRIRVVYNRDRNTVWIHYPDQSSTGSCNACIVYHLVTKQWGRNNVVAQHAFGYVQPGVVIDSVTGVINSYSDPIDSDRWNPSSRSVAVFNSSNVLQTLTGSPATSTFTTEEFGDEEQESFMDEIRLRYAAVPSSASAIGYTLDESSETADTNLNLSSSDIPANARNKFDLRQQGRFHKVQFTFSGNCRVTGKRPKLQMTGGR